MTRERELLTAKQIAEEFHMASAAVARGWLRRWDIPITTMRGHRHEHLYDAEEVRRTRHAQMGGKAVDRDRDEIEQEKETIDQIQRDRDSGDTTTIESDEE